MKCIKLLSRKITNIIHVLSLLICLKKNRCMEFECDVYVRSLFVNVLARSLIRTSTFLSRGIDV